MLPEMLNIEHVINQEVVSEKRKRVIGGMMDAVDKDYH